MKIAAVLFILSVCYIASTEQAAVPAGVHTYPSRSWKEMEHKAQQGIEAKSKAFSQSTEFPQFHLEELRWCANQNCPERENFIIW